MAGRFPSSSLAPPTSTSTHNNINVNMNIPGGGLGNNLPGGLGININNNGVPLLRATLIQVRNIIRIR